MRKRKSGPLDVPFNELGPGIVSPSRVIIIKDCRFHFFERSDGNFPSSITNQNVRFPDLGLCRGHECLQGLAISNIRDDSGASWRPQSAIIPPSTARDAPMM